MRIRGLDRVKRLVRQYRIRLRQQGVVLLYHRVAEADLDPHCLCVTPAHFAQHLEVLREIARPQPLSRFAQALLRSEVPRNSVGVTFDDGYVDNLTHAKPVLDRFEMPATVFVTSGYIGSRKSFLWDELPRLLFLPRTLPEELVLPVGDATRHWNLKGASYSNDAQAKCQRRWRMDQPDPGPRARVFRELHALLRPVPEETQRQALEHLSRWAGIALESPGLGRRVMTEQEIRELTADGLVDVGAHTVTHPQLSALPLPAQADEVVGSRARLEAITGRPVESFAYPFGARCDYTEETVELVRRSNFACSCSNFEGLVKATTDRYQIPRFHVVDCDGRNFRRMLEGWLSS